MMRPMVFALAVVMVAGVAFAQGMQQQSQQPSSMPQSMQGSGQYQPLLHPADDLLGMQIQNNQGEKLGSLEDIVLEPGLNYVAYGVLSSGGVLGMGENFYAIPWDTLQLSSDHKNLVLNLPAQAFEQAKGFNKDRWPDRADQRWRMQAMGQQPMGQQPSTSPSSDRSWRDQQYREQQQWRQQQDQPQAMNQQQRSSDEVYGRPAPQSRQWESDTEKWSETPRSESDKWGEMPQGQQRVQTAPGRQYGSQQQARGDATEGFKFRRVSQLLGLDVQTFGGQERIGDLKDVVLDVQQGLVAYGIIGIQGGKNAPVPWSAIEIRPMDEVALIEATSQTLDQVAFEGDMLPDLSNPQYAQSIHSQFNREPYWEVLGFVGGPQGQRMQMQQRPMRQQPMMQQHGMQQDPLLQYFDPQNITVISGTVESIGSFDDPSLGIQGQRLRVRTDDGQTVTVHAGPRQFLEQKGLMLRQNEQIQVRGSFATVSGRSVFIASDIRTQEAEVQLRDQQGKAMWSEMSMQQQQQY